MRKKDPVRFEIGRTRDDSICHLYHPHQPYRNDQARDAGELADFYVRHAAPIYGFKVSLASEEDGGKGKSAEIRLRRVEVKPILSTRVVSYEQMLANRPVWNAGFTAVLQPKGQQWCVTGSHHTVRRDLRRISRPKPGSPYGEKKLSSEIVGRLLGLKKTEAAKLIINRLRPMIYFFEPSERTGRAIRPESAGDGGRGAPALPLPPAPKSLRANRFYSATEVLFTLALPGFGKMNWRAFVEERTGAVLYVRPLTAGAGPSGLVFPTDPMTASGGTTPTSSALELNPWRARVNLSLTPPPAGPWELKGEFVQLGHYGPPTTPPPTRTNGQFDFDATTDDFAAVNAFHHAEGLFQMMKGMGFNMAEYFDGTTANPGFPIVVDHCAVDSRAHGNTSADGCMALQFGRIGRPGLSEATDPRLIAHEFCHALIWDSTHRDEFGFAHSAGDALAAILHAPGSRATDLGLCFPWLPNMLSRRHDRPVVEGWCWGGSQDGGRLQSENILSTTLFRVYESLGGGSASLTVQQAAARRMAYLIIRAIGSLGLTPVSDPRIFSMALREADRGTALFDGVPGGCFHKVVRWSFEQQGLYQPADRATPYRQAGDPPPVDVFIDDARSGGYAFFEDYSSTELWNRLTATPGDGPVDHQSPIAGRTNYLYVQVRNRGTQIASNIVVSAYQRKTVAAQLWPGDWEPFTTASLPAPNLAARNGVGTVGPFLWRPRSGRAQLLVSCSAQDDPSNADPASNLPCAAGPTPIEQLVPCDNNIATRTMNVLTRPSKPRGLRVLELR